jgi:hypothetical protein
MTEDERERIMIVILAELRRQVERAVDVGVSPAEVVAVLDDRRRAIEAGRSAPGKH